MNYEIKDNDEIIIDEGKRYAVKAPWTKVDGSLKSYTTRVVAEGAMDMGGGWYGAEFVEAMRNEDGTWEITMHCDEAQEDEDAFICGYWGWNEQQGVRYFLLEEVMAPEKTDPSTRDYPVWMHAVR